MDPLPLHFPDAFTDEPGFGMDFDETPPPRRRPVQLAMIRGEAVLRIPGVKVFARIDAAPWDLAVDEGGADDGGCWFDAPHVEAAFFDRATGTTALRVGQTGSPCYCYTETLHPRLDAAPGARHPRRGPQPRARPRRRR